VRKKILCILGSILLLSSLVGCKSNNTPTTNQPQITNTVKEFTKSEELPTTKTKYEYLGNNTSIEKDFKEDSNFNAITELVNNFNKAMVEIDYTKVDTFFDYRNYISSGALTNQKNIDDQVESTNFKDKKLQVEYIKTNIDNVTFNSYSDTYFVEYTYYSLIKNDPAVAEQNKYYQNKYYLLIIKENDKWVVDKWNGFSSVRAEQTPTLPITYMLDIEKTKSVYLNEKELDKMKEMQAVKDRLEAYFKDYYSKLDYQKTDGFTENMLKYIANDSQKDMKDFYESTLKDVKENKYKTEFKSIDFKLINYTTFDNVYYITLNVNYHINSNNQNIKTPLMIKLVKENNEWKISYYHKIGVNLIISQDN
jgi:hypothetical protein